MLNIAIQADSVPVDEVENMFLEMIHRNVLMIANESQLQNVNRK